MSTARDILKQGSWLLALLCSSQLGTRKSKAFSNMVIISSFQSLFISFIHYTIHTPETKKCHLINPFKM